MALHSKVRIFVHLIWGTHNHERVLNRELRIKIYQHLLERARELKIIINKMNLQPEHVHTLLELPSNKSIAEIAQNFKGECSNWINDNNLTVGKFRWQRGYGAYSVSISMLSTVENYIKNQDEHHKRRSFTDEYKEWAMRYGVWSQD